MYKLSTRYKKYGNGGFSWGNSEGQSTMKSGFGAGFHGLTLASEFFKPDDMGRKPLAGDIIGNAAKFGQIGMSAGPLGAGIGAAFGAGIGLIDNLTQKRKNENLKTDMRITDDRMEREYSSAVLANDPSLVHGNRNAGYYANGGPLSTNYLAGSKAVGGMVKPLSSESVEVVGNTHEQGGVEFPQQQVELEDKETVHNGFVFSEELGFAAAHKRLAKAIGKIESKGPMTPERVNAVTRLKEKEEDLKLTQEYLKQQLGIQ